MSQIDTIITKVLSGNGSDADNIILNNWIEESEDNKTIYNQRLLIWQFVGKVKKNPEVNMIAAWEKFNSNKDLQEKAKNKSFFYYKIAAIFIVLLTSASLIYLFTVSSLDNNNTHFAKNLSIKNDNNNALNFATISEKSEPNKIKVKHYAKRKNTSYTHEIVLQDSSSATITKSSVLSFLNNSESHTRIASLSGAGLFDIKPQDKDFVLETAELKITVQGTKFNIKTATEESKFVEISVEEGFMEVFEKENPSNKITITSNQKYIYDIEKHIFTESTQEIEASSKWKKFINKIFKK
ncbi:MAG: FecR family protein [Bacteroidota bacterium]